MPSDTGSQASYESGANGLYAARHILFLVPKGASPAAKDSIRRKAESKGTSMSDYLIDLIDRDVHKQTMTLDAWLDMVSKNPRIDLGRPAADFIREMHDEEDARWDAYFASRESATEA